LPALESASWTGINPSGFFGVAVHFDVFVLNEKDECTKPAREGFVALPRKKMLLCETGGRFFLSYRATRSVMDLLIAEMIHRMEYGDKTKEPSPCLKKDIRCTDILFQNSIKKSFDLLLHFFALEIMDIVSAIKENNLSLILLCKFFLDRNPKVSNFCSI